MTDDTVPLEVQEGEEARGVIPITVEQIRLVCPEETGVHAGMNYQLHILARDKEGNQYRGQIHPLRDIRVAFPLEDAVEGSMDCLLGGVDRLEDTQ